MIDVKNDLENGMFRRKVSDDGKYEIGIHPVLFGFRIRAGRVGDMGCRIDYCCQTDKALIKLVYNCVQSVIQTRVARNEPVFDNFPVPENKLYNDPLALTELIQMTIDAEEIEPIDVSDEELQSYRREAFQNLGIQG